MSAQSFPAINQVLQDYFDGLYYSDTQRLSKVFHPQAVYACAVGEKPLIYSMSEYFPIVDARPAPASRGEKRQDRILSIDWIGPATALAKVACAIETKHFVDLLSLICVNGKWQIISKVFHYDIKN